MVKTLMDVFFSTGWFGVLGLMTFAWLCVLTLWFYRLARDYRRLTKGVASSDLKEVWQQHLTRLENLQRTVEELRRRVEQMILLDKKHLQKVALVRFNPFADTGGDQSFSLSLLDDLGNGLVISSLHGRNGTRVYAKSVAKFEGNGHELSREEKEVIADARKS